MNKHVREELVREYCLSPYQTRKTLCLFSIMNRFVRWTPSLEVEQIL